MEKLYKFTSIEQARNAAIQWLEERAVVFGPHRKIEIGRIGAMRGAEVGTSSSHEPFWRIRLDYDPSKGPHFNAEVGKKAAREKAAFLFLGDEAAVKAIAARRKQR